MTTSAVPTAVLDLSGERTSVRPLLADLYRHRDLLRLLARQDFHGRYRSASLGLAWSVLLPVLQGVVIAVVFAHIIGGGRTGNYVPYVIVGITVWSYMQQSVTAGSSSIVDNGAIAGRIYFPRMTLPAVPPTANLPGLLISFVVAEVVTLASGAGIHVTLLLVPGVVVLAWLLVASVGAIATMAHVYSRDVRYVVQAGMLVLFYATPIIYRLDAQAGIRALPHKLRPIVIANPFTGVIELARYAFLGHADALLPSVVSTVAWVVVLSLGAVVVYSRFERVACDRL